MLEMLDNEDIAPSKGLDVSTLEFTSTPDGNTVKIQFIRPQTDDVLPCVYYIHGGGMASMSCFDGMYRSWGRIIAHQGVAVAMVDFRNSHDAVVGARGGAVPGRPRTTASPGCGSSSTRPPSCASTPPTSSSPARAAAAT